MLDTLEEKRRFMALMTGLSDMYDKVISKNALALYWQTLREYDFEAVQRAAEAHMKNPETAGSFMPKPSEFVKMMQGSTGDQSAIAWSKAEEAVRRAGPYQDVVFDDAIIHRVLADMGGWIWLCSQDDKAWPFVGNDFKTRYKGYRMRGEIPDYAPILIGQANAHNSKAAANFMFKPLMIGDKAKAQAVMAGGTSAPLIQMQHATAAVPTLAHEALGIEKQKEKEIC